MNYLPSHDAVSLGVGYKIPSRFAEDKSNRNTGRKEFSETTDVCVGKTPRAAADLMLTGWRRRTGK